MDYSDITSALSAAGIDVMLPGAKQDVCLAPYVVVQRLGTFPFAGTRGAGYSLVAVHCFVPLGRYPSLAPLAERVKDALRPLEPDLRPSGGESAHFINDRFRAHAVTLQYVVLRTLRHLSE
jgi:hypothetical protein